MYCDRETVGVWRNGSVKVRRIASLVHKQPSKKTKKNLYQHNQRMPMEVHILHPISTVYLCLGGNASHWTIPTHKHARTHTQMPKEHMPPSTLEKVVVAVFSHGLASHDDGIG